MDKVSTGSEAVQRMARRRGNEKMSPSSGPGTADNAEGSRCVFAARRCVPGLLSFHRLSLLILMTMPGERRARLLHMNTQPSLAGCGLEPWGPPPPPFSGLSERRGTAPNP